MIRRHRKDANQDAICAAAERLGWLVERVNNTNLGYDAILTKAGRTVRIEIKDGAKPKSKQRLTTHEKEVHARLRAHGAMVDVISSVDELAIFR